MARTSLSSVQQFVKGFETHPFFIGIDVHKRSYHLALGVDPFPWTLYLLRRRCPSCQSPTHRIPRSFGAAWSS